MTSLYPERAEVRCSRCCCWHWGGGRCFRDDPVGWPIIQKAQQDERRRAETLKALREIEAAKAPENGRRKR